MATWAILGPNGAVEQARPLFLAVWFKPDRSSWLAPLTPPRPPPAAGAGKTTFMNLLSGDLEPVGGESRRSHKLRIGRCVLWLK